MSAERDELPQGWTRARVGDLVVDSFYGPRFSKEDYAAGGIPTIRTTDMDDVGNIVLRDPPRVVVGVGERERFELHEGDLLVTRSGSIGKCAVYQASIGPAIPSAYLIRFRPNQRLCAPRFLLMFLLSPRGQVLLGSSATAVTQANVNARSVSDIQLPTAPLAEQHRIVAKLEALNERSRRAKAALDAIPALIERFKQSVLAAAFRGDLTADWRAKHPDVEPASELLKRIRVERRRRWEEAELEKMRAKGKAPTDDRWKAKYVEPEPVDESELPELPAGWCWVGLEELRAGDAPMVYGIILPGDDVPGGVPYVRPVDIDEDGEIDVDELKRTSPEIAAQYARASLKMGDVVLSIVGTIGKVAVASSALDGANITQSSIRIRPGYGTTSEFLRWLLRAPQLVGQYEKYRFGNAVQRLNVEHVRQLVVPLPPADEQETIVSRVVTAMRRVAAIRDEQARAELARLDRAILAKAFRGELVPQDPNDEPAPVLLERIRAEREKTNGEAAGRKSKKGVNGRDGSTPRRGRPRGTHEARE